jgi:hypothetical protein
MYYHILEYGDYGNIGYQGYYETKEEAQKQVDKLSDYFPNQTFQIFVDNSKKEPPITTMNNGGGVDTIGFIPMDIEEKLALLSKWGGTNIKGVIGYLNAMIDSGVTDNDLVINPTKNTSFQRERAIEKKIKEIWEKIEPQYKGGQKGNMYYGTLKELIERNYIYENLLQKFKPFRKNQKFDNGGGVGKIKLKDKVFWKGNEYTLSKITDDRIGGMIDKKYHLYSYKVGVPNVILDSLKDVKKKMAYDIFIDKKSFDNGGGVENAEMPMRERTTITKPTTTPTTTPSKPDKKNPYKPKHIPKPKARK